MPDALVRDANFGSAASMRFLTYCARARLRRSLTGSLPERLVWPTMARHASLLALLAKRDAMLRSQIG